MRGNSHVRFGGAGRGNGPPERATPRPGPTLHDRLAASCRRLTVRSERRADILTGFVYLAYAAICLRMLRSER